MLIEIKVAFLLLMSILFVIKSVKISLTHNYVLNYIVLNFFSDLVM